MSRTRLCPACGAMDVGAFEQRFCAAGGHRRGLSGFIDASTSERKLTPHLHVTCCFCKFEWLETPYDPERTRGLMEDGAVAASPSVGGDGQLRVGSGSGGTGVGHRIEYCEGGERPKVVVTLTGDASNVTSITDNSGVTWVRKT